MAYTRSFYNWLQEGSLRSAEVIVPLVMDWIKPRSVADVGCGIGTWLSVFKKHGVTRMLGLDGGYLPVDLLLCPRECFQTADLAKPLNVQEQFDLAVSLEVGEHLPADAATTLVNSLTSLAPVILFSAAVPWQGGTDHINEQWPDYWIALFKNKNYVVIDAIRPVVWNNAQVEPWYRQNTLLFVREDSLANHPALVKARERTDENRLSIVHPDLFLHANTRPRGPVLKIAKWLLLRTGSRLKNLWRFKTQ